MNELTLDPQPDSDYRKPRIIFCTTCKGRTEHLKRTLPANLRDNAGYGNCRFVVLDYGDQGELREYLATYHGRLGTSVSGYRFETDKPFNVAHAKNMAMRCGMLEGADILVTVDADNFTGPGFAQYIADRMKDLPSSGAFLCPDFPLIQSLPHGPDRPLRGFAGRLAIRTQDFIKMGGYDETYDTWRGEDIDLIARLQRLGYAMRHIDNRFLMNTIPHNAKVRFKEYPHARQYENKHEVKIIGARTETVVNYGNIGLGVVYRNFSGQPMELTPIPTRVFGIGLHKTGTTSLHEAFQILGFDSFHWGMGEAPRIWQEMNSAARSNTLEQWYALCDLPIPLLYEKLDKAYPGSKFVLTLRDEKKWLKSVERLWNPAYNPHRWIWEKYPFSHRIHTVLYGRKDFDAETFLARYRRHNAEVVRYFGGRLRDLLVMNLDHGDGWPELCRFLSVPVPTVPYPRGNPTAPVEIKAAQNRASVLDEGFAAWLGMCKSYPGVPDGD